MIHESKVILIPMEFCFQDTNEISKTKLEYFFPIVRGGSRIQFSYSNPVVLKKNDILNHRDARIKKLKELAKFPRFFVN